MRLAQQRAVRQALPSDTVEAQLLNVLSHEPIHVDEIRNQTGLPIDRVSATLVMMELKGLIRQVGGMNYVMAREARGEYRVE